MKILVYLTILNGKSLTQNVIISNVTKWAFASIFKHFNFSQRI